nr:hypothetical protein [Tanacetum cinerariifolium]
TVEDKILVPKPPKNCARCTRCGYLVDGPNCQGCTILRQELKENLVIHSPDFQNSSEPSNASTNDNGSFIDKIIFDLKRAPDSPNQFHCFHCKDVLRDGEACKRYGIFCKRCTCKYYGKDAHIGYNCPSKVLVISIPKPFNNQTINELPQALPIFHSTFHSEAKSPFTLVTPTEPIDSLSMGDEHLDTIPVTESDEFIKSCVENLVPNPSESEGENECDVPAGFITFSNVLLDADYDFDSSDDQSLSDEDFPKKIYANPLFDEEIIPMEIDQHSFNAESDLIESMTNHDSSVIISLKIDSLFDEFAGELTLLKSIPLGIKETDCHPEKEIRFAKRLLYDNSSPCPPEEIVSDNSNADIESFSPSPIPNLDSGPLMEEIDLSFNLDDPMPPGIEDDDYDSERDIPILEELLNNYSLSLPANESYHFDIPSPYRAPAKPPDGCQKPGHLAARLGCAETKVATWDDLAFKLITLG